MMERSRARTDIFYAVSKGVLIPSWSVLLAASCVDCLFNSLLHYLARPGALRRVLHIFLNPRGVPLEFTLSLGSWAVYALAYDSAVDAPNDTTAEAPSPLSPRTQGGSGGHQRSLQHVRLEAQQLVFLYNPKYMMIATAKSLTMLVVLQYHYDYRGGWDRLVVCSAANLMSGLLTPVLEYAAGMLLPIDSKRDRRSLGVEVEEPRDSVLIVEVLMRIGQLELEDLETVLIQGATFIIFGAILLPALLIFCVPGFAAYPWVFFPPWIVYAVLRYFYYREGGLPALPLPVGQRWTGSLFSSPVGEVSKAVLMKIITLFLLQWTLQCSFLFGFVLLDGWSYHDGLRLEAEHQLWGWYNPKEMTRFHWICFASQLFF